MTWEEIIQMPLEYIQYQDRIGEAIQAGERVYPSPFSIDIFRAMTFFHPEDTEVVILGEAPYSNAHATGLAFGVSPTTEMVPSSLRNIITEVYRDTGESVDDISLESWASQGVLLLNTCLTSTRGEETHASWNWGVVVGTILAYLSEEIERPIVFLGWGTMAEQLLKENVNDMTNTVFTSSDPSPETSTSGPHPFAGCGHFSKANEALEREGRDEIYWGDDT